MRKSLQFLSSKSVLLFGVALAILANPFIYLIIGSVMAFTKSIDNPGVEYNTQEPFIQAMIFTSSVGILIIIISRVSAWILAFQKIKSSKN